MQHWQRDPDLDGLRDPAATRLSADERQACQQLWGEVEALRSKARQEPR
jgi:hypothetical protein